MRRGWSDKLILLQEEKASWTGFTGQRPKGSGEGEGLGTPASSVTQLALRSTAGTSLSPPPPPLLEITASPIWKPRRCGMLRMEWRPGWVTSALRPHSHLPCCLWQHILGQLEAPQPGPQEPTAGTALQADTLVQTSL